MSNTAPAETASAPTMRVKNYMTQAVLCTLFLFFPTGIAAIYFAAKVDRALRAGDFAQAMRASGKAKMFCWISLAVGGLFFVVLGAGH